MTSLIHAYTVRMLQQYAIYAGYHTVSKTLLPYFSIILVALLRYFGICLQNRYGQYLYNVSFKHPGLQDAHVTDQKPALTEPKTTGAKSTVEAYRPPVWAMNCPVDTGYHLEVIKNGTPLSECTVDLACGNISTDTDAQELSFCLFGRQPELFYAPDNQLHGQCTVMAHPSISRLHAVLQYGQPPPSIARTSAARTDVTGWYLQDLDSTHGTFVNKVSQLSYHMPWICLNFLASCDEHLYF